MNNNNSEIYLIFSYSLKFKLLKIYVYIFLVYLSFYNFSCVLFVERCGQNARLTSCAFCIFRKDCHPHSSVVELLGWCSEWTKLARASGCRQHVSQVKCLLRLVPFSSQYYLCLYREILF